MKRASFINSSHITKLDEAESLSDATLGCLGVGRKARQILTSIPVERGNIRLGAQYFTSTHGRAASFFVRYSAVALSALSQEAWRRKPWISAGRTISSKGR